jgi:DinB family protein
LRIYDRAMATARNDATTASSSFLADTTNLLARTPAVLTALLAELPPAWADTPDTPDGWRPRDVVGHLITGDLGDWITRTNLILEHGTSKPFDRFDRFAMLDRDVDRSLDALLAEFVELRGRNLEVLAGLGLGEDDLDRRGLHPALGEVTLRNLLAAWTVHDLDHIAQIYAAMAGSRDAAVGPWKTYLGILLRRTDPSARAG